jgi:hypothetical protein
MQLEQLEVDELFQFLPMPARLKRLVLDAIGLDHDLTTACASLISVTGILARHSPPEQRNRVAEFLRREATAMTTRTQ